MGKNKKKEYVLDAVLDEETYMAYKSGQAIDNNGLRSPKGSYWPTLRLPMQLLREAEKLQSYCPAS